MIRTLILATAMSCGLTFAAAAQSPATDYPTHQVRVIVPFAPGGGTDALSRLLAEALRKELGQPFVVENVGGAGGTLGVSQAARAAPDGYTILTATPSITINPYLQKNISYNPIKDFDPVIQTTTSPAVLVVRSDSPLKSVQDVIDAARAKPGDINYGTAGIGSFAHLSTELFASMTKTQLTHIPYRGTGPALVDLLGGRLQVQFENAPGVLSQVKSGELRALGVGTAKKSTILPDVPTIATTVPGYESSSWFGILVPAGTPRPIIDKLNATLNKVIADPEIAKKLSELGVERVGGTPEQFGTYLKAKVDEMAIIAKAANLQAQ
jgi:tripartite-type tricarboxylate transporter receptor subunit TctC